MISLSRLNGRTVAINPDFIAWIEVTPDTTLCLAGGDRLVVKEELEEVLERILAYRKLVGPTLTASEVVNAAGRRKSQEVPSTRNSIRSPVDTSASRNSLRSLQPIVHRK